MEFEHRKRIIEQVQNGEMTLEAANSLFKSMGFEEIQ
jgi:exonuclease VII small subunit